MLDIIFSTMEQPQPFGTFHLIFFFSFIVLATLLIIFFKNCSDKTFRTIVLIFWIVIVCLECLKQIIWNYDYTNNCFKSDFNWSSFPYQFCSLPFYLFPLVVFLKDSKFKEILNVFLSTFVFFGGFAYFFFPVSFCNYTIINIQTMVHHGVQATVGLFIFVHEYDKMTYKNVLKAIPFLIATVLVAIGLNALLTGVFHKSLNLFELNPIEPTQAVVFGDILKATNYFVFVLIYIVGFTAFASICYFVIKYIIKLTRLIRKH